MTFLAPTNLWLLIVVGIVAVIYVAAQLHRRRYAVVFTNLPLLASIAPRRPGWRRHLTAAAFLGMLAALVLALAKPAHGALVPDNHARVIIAIDASRSMEANDVPPSRLAVAREAAGEFVTSLPEQVRVGLVVFSGQTTLKVAPTANRAAIIDAIRTIKTSDGTAVGDAIFTSLDALRGDDVRRDGSGATNPAGTSPRGSHPAIVVLSDGESTLGRSTAEAVAAAKRESVPISTIAVGTVGGSVRIAGISFDVPVQQRELRQIAKLARGHHYDVTSPLQLKEAYGQLGSELAYRSTSSELTSWFLVGALGAGGLAAAGSLGWGARVP
jgi:Ca-activated chloride channel homolog